MTPSLCAQMPSIVSVDVLNFKSFLEGCTSQKDINGSGIPPLRRQTSIHPHNSFIDPLLGSCFPCLYSTGSVFLYRELS